MDSTVRVFSTDERDFNVDAITGRIGPDTEAALLINALWEECERLSKPSPSIIARILRGELKMDYNSVRKMWGAPMGFGRG